MFFNKKKPSYIGGILEMATTGYTLRGSSHDGLRTDCRKTKNGSRHYDTFARAVSDRAD